MTYFVKSDVSPDWFSVTQKRWQQLERACGFQAPEGQDATNGFSGKSPKSGLSWQGITYNPYEEKK